MTLITGSRLFGILLIAASLPLDPGVVLAASQTHSLLQEGAAAAPSAALEARLQRIAAALRSGERQIQRDSAAGSELLSWWRNGFGNGGFRNGGFGNGGFRNGGFGNGGFRNGGFRNGGFRNGLFANF
jgi:rSAM-associated Gly-rich repeat protein